ncbi:hypothetical protein [Neorhizobium galegae]|uniref:Uncharacterized protein n=1 Tax=Neorhizobium galegae bv. orientalis str. HAMBI 540 TaxID=1028800 RepID=A0A068SR73_NEOGA|nr:hypothetical protein [Neorhizobium galegae]MCQ1856203.1 hypothetical protein [Neorhizobium galegae]CDN47575.1 Hypothetical protein RG540_CH13950 [Neorhizobium galegae bv. orientalis str. HAMBI 540]
MDDNSNFYLMFGRLEGKVDTLLSQQGGINKRMDDLDARVSSLETLKAQGTGILSSIRWGYVIIAAGIGAFSDDIKGLIFR